MNQETAIKEMDPLLRYRAMEWENKMRLAGIPFIYTSVARTVQTQIALYAQGRNKLITTNQFRKDAGLPPITSSTNKKIVTWTMNSQHIINLNDNDPNNNYSHAFDFAIGTRIRVWWNLKVDVNKNKIGDYKEAARLLNIVGLEAGYDWSNRDATHAQLSQRDRTELGLASHVEPASERYAAFCSDLKALCKKHKI